MTPRKLLHDSFEVGIILKGIDAVLEMIGGLLFWTVSQQAIGDIVSFLTQHELAEDPHDIIASALLHWGTGLSLDAKTFGAVYLLSHGLVKIVLVAAIMRGKTWAYPVMVVFLLLFSVYQMYRFSYSGSLAMAALTAFDLLLAWLVWSEYRRRQAQGVYW